MEEGSGVKSYFYVKSVKKKSGKTYLYLTETFTNNEGRNATKTIRRLTEEEARKYGWKPSEVSGETQPETASESRTQVESETVQAGVSGNTPVPAPDVSESRVSGKVVVGEREGGVSGKVVEDGEASGLGERKELSQQATQPDGSAPMETKAVLVEAATQSSTEHHERGNVAVKTETNSILPVETTTPMRTASDRIIHLEPEEQRVAPSTPTPEEETPRKKPAEEELSQLVFGYTVEDHGIVNSVGRLYKLTPIVAGLKVGHILIAEDGDVTCACDSRHSAECEHTQAIARAKHPRHD